MNVANSLRLRQSCVTNFSPLLSQTSAIRRKRVLGESRTVPWNGTGTDDCRLSALVPEAENTPMVRKPLQIAQDSLLESCSRPRKVVWEQIDCLSCRVSPCNTRFHQAEATPLSG